MNNWENAVVTNKGIALLTKLIAGETLHITRGEIGSGYVTPGILQNQVAVTSPMQQVSFREVTYPEEGKCALACFITNDGLNTAYTANQVGIYATDPDEGEILFFITQANSGKGLDIPTETEMPGYSSEWTFYFKYGQASGVTITVNPSHSVNFAEMEAHVNNKISKITPESIGAATPAQVTEHNTAVDSHNDIRLLITGLSNRLNALANSDDTTLDQMAEVVEYIKDNRELIEQITTGKVSVGDIVNDLVTNVVDRPLSAAQGVALKLLIDTLTNTVKALKTENWTFTVEKEDGSTETVTKAVYVG